MKLLIKPSSEHFTYIIHACFALFFHFIVKKHLF